MKTLSGLLLVVLGFAILAGLIYGGYYLVETLWTYYTALEFTVRVILLSAMASIFFAAVIVAASIKSSAKIALTSPVISEKIALYKKLIEIQFSTNGASKGLEQLRPTAVLLASGSVLEIVEKIISLADDDNNYDGKLNGLYSQLIKNIRLEMGHKSTIGDPKIQQLFTARKPLDMRSQQSL